MDRRDVVERRQVLIVDDNAQLRQLLSALLRSDGRFEVVGVAADGVEALRLIDELEPELMLLGLSMPGMDGIEVLERLTDRAPAPSTVVLSGYLDDALRDRVLAAGATLCIEKGVDCTELTDHLATAARSIVRHGSPRADGSHRLSIRSTGAHPGSPSTAPAVPRAGRAG